MRAADDPTRPTVWCADPSLVSILVAHGLVPTSESAADVRVAFWPATGGHQAPWVAVVASDAHEAAEQAGAIETCHVPEELGHRVCRAWRLWQQQVRSAAYRRLFELSTSWQEVTGPQIRLVDVNTAFERQSGVSRADALGRTTGELFRAGTHGDGFYEAIGAALKTSGVWRGTMIARRTDGGYAFQDAVLAGVDLNGRRVGFVASKQLADPPGRIGLDVQSILQQLAPATLVVASGQIVDASASLCRMVGRAREDLVDRPISVLECEPIAADRQVAPGDHERVRTRIHGADGAMAVEVTLHGSRSGARTFELWLLRDIREQLEHERTLQCALEAAEAASRAKSRFLANMSHELRTPLNAIIGYAELVAESAPGEALDDLDRIRNSGTHLLRLVDDLLDLARVESGHAPIDVSRVAVGPLLDSIAESTVPIVRANRNQLRVSDPGTVAVLADLGRLRQILLNLLSNACKFTRDGVVTISVAATAGRVSFAVADTGPGPTPEQCDLLFQPFVQAHDGIRAEYGGTGLGLAISRELTERMGGTIRVESEPGNGARFIVELPLAED